MFSIEWEGFDDVKKALDKWEADAIAAVAREVLNSGEHLLQQAQALAPKETGDLEGSGTLSGGGEASALLNIPAGAAPKIDPAAREISVEVSFHKEYAARQHEGAHSPGPITRGKPGTEVGPAGRKYLERPLVYFMPRYLRNIADAIRRTTEGR